MPRLSSVAGLAGQIVSADRSAVMADLAAGLFAELNRRTAEQLADLSAATARLGVEPFPEHIVRSDDLCRN